MLLKCIIKKIKMQITDWVRTYAIYIFDKRVVSRINKYITSYKQIQNIKYISLLTNTKVSKRFEQRLNKRI